MTTMPQHSRAMESHAEGNRSTVNCIYNNLLISASFTDDGDEL